MADLKKEYTDIKDREHRVEHVTVLGDDQSSKERITEELINALTKAGHKI